MYFQKLLFCFVLYQVYTVTSGAKIYERQTFVSSKQAGEQDSCNLNFCFSIDGSRGISEDRFQAQLDIIELIVALFETAGTFNYSAVQATSTVGGGGPSSVSIISNSTESVEQFVTRVRESSQNDGMTSLASGIRFCSSQAADGNNNFLLLFSGGDVSRSDEKAAMLYRESDGSIVAVNVGESSVADLAMLTGNISTVFSIDDFFDIVDFISESFGAECTSSV